MGWQATGWAFRAPIDNPGCKFVLVALAERAGNEDDDSPTWECFPSIDTISKYTSQGYRTIQRHLVWLEENGFISRVQRVTSKGRKGCFHFTLHRDVSTGGQIGQWPKTTENPPKSVEIGQTEPVTLTGHSVIARETSAFDEWWTAYPRKVAKDAARKAYAAAVMVLPPEKLMHATERFADEVRDRPRDKIPHAATWLNGKRWEDEPEANRSESNGIRTAGADRGATQHAERLGAMQRGALEALDRRRRERWSL